jgi:pyridoxamine 5'-phosphate oxidase
MVDPAHPKALSGACEFSNQVFPDPLPSEPMKLLSQWLDDAATQKVQPNPNSMALATVNSQGQPASRIVLCRRLNADRGTIGFFTNYTGRKGLDIAANPRVGASFHWDDLDRQVRIEGIATKSPPRESDEYFLARPLLSRVAAYASEQSQPIASREALIAKDEAARKRFGVPAGEKLPEGFSADVPRPDFWGGYRIWISAIEFWLGHTNRLHDRVLYTRALAPAIIDHVPGFEGGHWKITRLQP